MPLSSGTKIGSYEILDAIGAGGMGEVYRAKDPRLNRIVAIKILPADFAADTNRTSRFEQEARSASALNHPNIITIHEIGSVDSTSYIAMEFVEGKSLREFLNGPALPIRRIVQIAAQLADGLAKAHAAGIVHRDLKPENIMVSKDGFVKILDFGLAKLTVASTDEVSALQTIPRTDAGTVLGTVGYMSPEQASGRPSDFRSDQFSLGVILYEMIAQKRPFQRKTSVRNRATSASSTVRLSFLPPEGTTLGSGLAISPDGNDVAFVAQKQGTDLLWIRHLNAMEAQPLARTEGALLPFWSPDGRYIAFFAGGKLKKVQASGGSVQSLCNVGDARGGSWNLNGIIIFAPDYRSSLYKISEAGGISQPLTHLAAKEVSHRYPQFLPDGRHFLYMGRLGEGNQVKIYIGSLDSSEKKEILTINSLTQFASPDSLLFIRERTLLAQHLDTKKLVIFGDPQSIGQGLRVHGASSVTGYAAFSASQNGRVVYQTGGNITNQLTWFNRKGERLENIGPPGLYDEPSLSADGKQLAVAVESLDSGIQNIWTFDLSRGTSSRLTFRDGDGEPLWSPDGTHFAYGSAGSTFYEVHIRSINGPEDKTIASIQKDVAPSDWSSDGRYLASTSHDAETLDDVWIVPVAPGTKPFPFLQSDFNEREAHFSPDMHWIAYTSDESGRPEVYVQSFPTAGNRQQVSIDGGEQASWRADGKELFYVARDGKLMSVSIQEGASIQLGTPQPLFDSPILMGRTGVINQSYVVSADGQRFLLNTLQEATPAVINVVLNWNADSK